MRSGENHASSSVGVVKANMERIVVLSLADDFDAAKRRSREPMADADPARVSASISLRALHDPDLVPDLRFRRLPLLHSRLDCELDQRRLPTGLPAQVGSGQPRGERDFSSGTRALVLVNCGRGRVDMIVPRPRRQRRRSRDVLPQCLNRQRSASSALVSALVLYEQGRTRVVEKAEPEGGCASFAARAYV